MSPPADLSGLDAEARCEKWMQAHGLRRLRASRGVTGKRRFWRRALKITARVDIDTNAAEAAWRDLPQGEDTAVFGVRGRPMAFTSHLFLASGADLVRTEAEWRRVADRYGLSVEVSADSWHHPGRTTLFVLWMPGVRRTKNPEGDGA